jgi:hypothetical protein
VSLTKRTKLDVSYSRGEPPHGDYCEICVHYEPQAGEAPTCECVVGSIHWAFWCRLFKKASASERVRNREMRGD